MNTLHKLKYLVPASILLFLSIPKIFQFIYSIFISSGYCLTNFSGISNEIFHSYTLLLPFLYLYFACMFLYLSDKPEKLNFLTSASLWICAAIVIVPFLAYVPFLGTLVYMLAYSNTFAAIFYVLPLIAFVFMLLGSFHKYIFPACLILAILVLGGAKMSESNRGCSNTPSIPLPPMQY